MELAKIRNKAKLEEGRGPGASGLSDGPLPSEPATVSAPELPVELNELNELFDTSLPVPDQLPLRTPAAPQVRFDPLAVILAGRQADQPESAVFDRSEELRQTADAEEDCQEYLCFMLGSEEYGINIMDIKELIKPRELTEVPHAPHFVDGIISLRGVIVPVFDLHKRLGLYSQPSSPLERVVIVRRHDSLNGLRVDSVTGVVRIPASRCEPAPAALEGIDRDFVSGIGRSDDRMVILLDIEHVADAGLYGGV